MNWRYRRGRPGRIEEDMEKCDCKRVIRYCWIVGLVYLVMIFVSITGVMMW